MGFLEDFQASLESLPAMLQRTYGLIRELDTSLLASQRQSEQHCEQEIDEIKRGIEAGNVAPDMSLIRFSDEALEEQKHCIRVADEKVALATQAYDMVDTHIQQLDQYMRKMEELRLGAVADSIFFLTVCATERELSATASPGGTPDVTTKSGRTGASGRGGRKKYVFVDYRARQAAVELLNIDLELPVDPNEPTYCFCKQVSFGEMVACDNPDCKIEWFHYGCVGLKEQPKGKWFCPNCVGLPKRKKGK
ncbi:PHD finger protein ING1 [Dendrobium catenatum]|uniref:PHD finger protein ING n=1 Tax=Dendrobium catenatum TaxID=906689 RepID=A0A2I0W844_9ASPA|nr:PHD finger protein ING1 [Dendrobium catenatum]